MIATRGTAYLSRTPLPWMRGVCGGLALGPVSVKTPNCGGGEIDSVALEDSLAVKLEDSLAENFVEKVVKAKRATGAGPPTPPPGILTADTGLEMQGSAGVEVIGPSATWTPNCGGGEIDSVALEDSLAVELEDSLAVKVGEENWDVEKVVNAKRAAPSHSAPQHNDGRYWA